MNEAEAVSRFGQALQCLNRRQHGMYEVEYWRTTFSTKVAYLELHGVRGDPMPRPEFAANSHRIRPRVSAAIMSLDIGHHCATQGVCW